MEGKMLIHFCTDAFTQYQSTSTHPPRGPRIRHHFQRFPFPNLLSLISASTLLSHPARFTAVCYIPSSTGVTIQSLASPQCYTTTQTAEYIYQDNANKTLEAVLHKSETERNKKKY